MAAAEGINTRNLHGRAFALHSNEQNGSSANEAFENVSYLENEYDSHTNDRISIYFYLRAQIFKLFGNTHLSRTDKEQIIAMDVRTAHGRFLSV